MMSLFIKKSKKDNILRYGTNFIWLSVEKMIRLVLGFFVGIYVARAIGPEKYGALNYAISFVAIFSVISTLGIEQILVRELVSRPRIKNYLLGSAMRIRIVGIVLMLFTIFIALIFQSGKPENILIFIISLGYIFSIGQVFELYFQSVVKSKYVALSQIIALFVCSTARFICAYNNAPLEYFAIIEASNMLLCTMGYVCFFYMIKQNIKEWRFNKKVALQLLKYSWPLGVAGAAGLIYMKIDNLMIQSMLGNYELGCYSAAVVIVEAFYFIPMALGGTLFPAIVSLKNSDAKKYNERLVGFFSLLLYLGLAITIGASLFGKIVPLLYGDAYLESYPIFMVYIWRLVLCSVGIGTSYYLVTENLQVFSMLFGIFGLLVNIISNYCFIKIWGGVGASFAAIITLFCIVYIFPMFFKKTRPMLNKLLKSFNFIYIYRQLV